jgi:hypothetical protein
MSRQTKQFLESVSRRADAEISIEAIRSIELRIYPGADGSYNYKKGAHIVSVDYNFSESSLMAWMPAAEKQIQRIQPEG